jgi:hypothetical protein
VTSPLIDAVSAVARRAVRDAGGTLDLAGARAAVVGALGGGVLDDDALTEVLDEALHGQFGPLGVLPGGVVADLATTGERLVLTHRLAEHEVAGARLDLDPDLAAVARLAAIDGGLHTPTGSRLRLREQRVRGAGRAGGVLFTTHLDGPPGWLADFVPGQVVAARADHGVLTLEPVADADVGPVPAGFADALDAFMDDLHEGDGSPVWGEELQWAAAAEHPGWLDRPRPPFGEMVVGAGLELDGRSVGRPGVWDDYERLSQLVATVARHDLENDDHDVLRDALAAFDVWSAAIAGPGPVAEAAEATDPATRTRSPEAARPGSSLRRRLHGQWAAALALLDELRWRGATGDQIDGFGQALGEGARGEDAAVGLWLRSRGAAIDGRAVDAERLSGQACDADAWFPPGVDEAAWYAGDRGRARDAANLLHRVRQPDDPKVEILRRYAQLGAPGVGRNDPCPCGSGRKFKQCHLGRAELPELDRVRWLLDKAREHVMRAAPIELLDDLLRDHDISQGADLVALDLLLFLEGWWSRFLEARGPLLSGWERDVGAGWTGGGVLSVFRVDRVDGDGRRHLRDAATGRVHVTEASLSFGDAGKDRLVCCRLLPLGDRWYGSGVVRMTSISERAGILDALGPDATADGVMAALFPQGDGPILQNTSGDPMLMCEVTLRPTDKADDGVVAERLDGALERDRDVDEPVWHLSRDTPGMEAAVIGTVRLDEGAIGLETNSVARRDELVELLGGVLGGVTVVSETRAPPARERALREERALVSSVKRAFGVDDEDDLLGDADDEDTYADDAYDDDAYDDDAYDEGAYVADDDVESQDLIDEYTRQQERRWLDQPIPALGGATPRAAAADDALRPDLLTLLAESSERGLFDNDRLRAELGLG